MLKSVKSRAEEQFAAVQKKDKQALKAKEKVKKDRADHIANLRAQRMAKEAAELEAAEKAAAEPAPAKKKAAAKKAAEQDKDVPEAETETTDEDTTAPSLPQAHNFQA